MTGLNLLSALLSIINRFSQQIDHMNPVWLGNHIMDAIYSRALNNAIPRLTRDILVGPDFLNSNILRKYVIDGNSDNNAGQRLYLRAGIPFNLRSDHLYGFIRREITYLRANINRQLPNPLPTLVKKFPILLRINFGH